MKAVKTKKSAARAHPKIDRRILRTRDALGDALVALMREKEFDDITVQEVLDRAGVGRATFYVLKSGKMSDVRALAQGFFARSIEERLQAAGIEIAPQQRSAQAHALAGSFFSLLDWWVDKGMKADPVEMDALFHRIAWQGLTGR